MILNNNFQVSDPMQREATTEVLCYSGIKKKFLISSFTRIRLRNINVVEQQVVKLKSIWIRCTLQERGTWSFWQSLGWVGQWDCKKQICVN